METTLYAFDAPEYLVSFPVPWPGTITDKSVKVIQEASDTTSQMIEVTHRLRRPTLAELIDHDKKSVYEQKQISDREDEFLSNNNAAAQWLWNQIILQIGGYPGMSSGLVDVSEETKSKMRGAHKEKALGYIYSAKSEIVQEECEITFDGGQWVLRLLIGLRDEPDYTLKFRLREWTEKERAAFDKADMKITSVRGAKKAHTKTVFNLKAYIELFDALFISCEGGSVGDGPFEPSRRTEFVTTIDATWKRVILQALTPRWQAQLSD